MRTVYYCWRCGVWSYDPFFKWDHGPCGGWDAADADDREVDSAARLRVPRKGRAPLTP